MTGPYIAANGIHVPDVNLYVPWYGAPVADVTLSDATPLSGSVSLVIGNLTLAMAVALGPTGLPRSRVFAGQTYARLVGGAGGWGTATSLSPYRNPVGVLRSTVLADVARVAVNPQSGTAEKVSLAAGLDGTLGTFYVPETGAPAGRLLAALANPLWWVDTAGVTRVAMTRTGVAIAAASAQVQHYDGGKGWVSVATEDVQGWATPGNTYASAMIPDGITINAARVQSGNEGVLRVEVLIT